MGNASKKPHNAEALRLMDGFLAAYEQQHPSKEDKKEAGAKIVEQHVHSVLLSIADEAEHFALNFSHDLLGDIGAIIVTQQIASLCPETISALYLRHCGLTKDIDRAFVTSLGECSAIARLDLSLNDLGSPLVLSIVRTLSDHKALASLALANTGADDEVCQELRKSAPKGLTTLDLSDNPNISDAGANEIYELIDQRTQFTKVFLEGCSIKDKELLTKIALRLERNLACARVLDECLLQLRYYRFDPNAEKRQRREVPHWVETMPRTLLKPRPSARFSYGHAETIGRRPTMEDSMLLHGQFRDSAHEDLFGVFDGHGGDECAKFVQRCFGLVLAQRLAQYPSPNDTEKAIKATYEAVDLECKARFNYQGTTALVAYIAGDTLWVSNAGDARAVLATKDGALRLSYDHKAEDKAEKERVEKEGGFVDGDDRVSGKLAVSRAFGDRDVGPWVKATPFITKHVLQPEDEFLILACDGVYDVMSDRAVVECVEKQIVQGGITDPQRWARKLVATAIKRETDDNVSVIIVSLAERRIEAKSNTPKVVKKREKSLSFTVASSQAAFVKRRDSAAVTGKSPLRDSGTTTKTDASGGALAPNGGLRESTSKDKRPKSEKGTALRDSGDH